MGKGDRWGRRVNKEEGSVPTPYITPPHLGHTREGQGDNLPHPGGYKCVVKLRASVLRIKVNIQ